jgi:hypothetical protein
MNGIPNSQGLLLQARLHQVDTVRVMVIKPGSDTPVEVQAVRVSKRNNVWVGEVLGSGEWCHIVKVIW